MTWSFWSSTKKLHADAGRPVQDVSNGFSGSKEYRSGESYAGKIKPTPGLILIQTNAMFVLFKGNQKNVISDLESGDQ